MSVRFWEDDVDESSEFDAPECVPSKMLDLIYEQDEPSTDTTDQAKGKAAVGER